MGTADLMLAAQLKERRHRGARYFQKSRSGRQRAIAAVLTIATSDSSGGAGIQADLKTFSALGTYGCSVIVALTAQNTRRVSAIHTVPPDFVAAQLDAVFDDIEIRAVKIGMLANAELISAVAEGLLRHHAHNIVLDPVMVAKSGDRLLREDAIDTLRERLLPLATILTPNLPEAGALLDAPAPDNERTMLAAAVRLRALRPQAVLVKGGHLDGAQSADLFDDGTTQRWLRAARLATTNTHGTGCTLSSAIAAYLARGFELAAAVEQAKAYVTAAIHAADGLAIGHGHGPVHHFHALWRESDGK